ncbi:hypothetical protein [Smaragdicoccus niigatensis]|uniref:hypothetical protein n=1 Tax=Smaragdicoccus niigatensis TaxID=359359 RepID=UPI0003802A70|nr:hypothetical protein [Smaragdicoccus niigatensis]
MILDHLPLIQRLVASRIADLNRRGLEPDAQYYCLLRDTHMTDIGQAKTRDEQTWITTGEIQHRLGCSDSTAYRLARRYGRQTSTGQWLTPADAIGDKTA